MLILIIIIWILVITQTPLKINFCCCCEKQQCVLITKPNSVESYFFLQLQQMKNQQKERPFVRLCFPKNNPILKGYSPKCHFVCPLFKTNSSTEERLHVLKNFKEFFAFSSFDHKWHPSLYYSVHSFDFWKTKSSAIMGQFPRDSIHHHTPKAFPHIFILSSSRTSKEGFLALPPNPCP